MRANRAAGVAALVLAVAGGLLIAAAPKGGGPAKAAPGEDRPEVQVVEISLGGEIAEHASVTMPFGPRPSLLRDYTASIRKAATDEAIRAIVLRLKGPDLSLAQVEELGEAIAEFQAAKKKVYAYAAVCGNLDYVVACAADRVVVAPGGAVTAVGLSAEVAYLKGLLDWAGIEVDVVQSGKHKALLEPFSQAQMSEEGRRVFGEFVDGLYERFIGLIVRGRGVKVEQARAWVDGAPYSAEAAHQAGLVDDVAYYDEFLEDVGRELGGKVEPVRGYHHLGSKGPDLSQFNLLTLFASMRPKPDIPRTSRPKVVVLYATGMIVLGRGEERWVGGITGKEIAKALASAREDETVKAVVLRIDSPGGAAATSDFIWREVQRTRQAGKPVVASLSSVAASGGYYIAMGADKIVAHPSTITGSIGVIGLKPNLAGLYEKLGIHVETFTRGKHAGLQSFSTGLSKEQRQRLQAVLDAVYDDFVTKAAAGRNMPREKMLELATGRVWTAAAAQKLGLVDELGGLKRAFDLAVELAGLQGRDVQPVILPRAKNFLEKLFSGAVGAEAVWARGLSVRVPAPLRGMVPSLGVLRALGREPVLALVPYTITIR